MVALRVCKDCNKEAITEQDLELFVNKKDCLYGKQNLCRRCNTQRVKINNDANKHKRDTSATLRRYNNKEKFIIYKGGECNDCGYKYTGNNHIVFDFHHLEPNEKDYRIASKIHYRFEDVKKEVDKCVLLCANCHRLRHGSNIENSSY